MAEKGSSCPPSSFYLWEIQDQTSLDHSGRNEVKIWTPRFLKLVIIQLHHNAFLTTFKTVICKNSITRFLWIKAGCTYIYTHIYKHSYQQKHHKSIKRKLGKQKRNIKPQCCCPNTASWKGFTNFNYWKPLIDIFTILIFCSS